MPKIRVLAILFGALSLAGAASAQSDSPLVQAVELEKAGRPGDAYTLLAPLVQAHMTDADFNYVFGLAALDSGRVAESILAFQRVLALQPDHAQARAEIARAYALAGDADTARAQFDTVLQDPSLPDPVRQRFTQISKSYRKQAQGGGSDVTGFVDIGTGYDTNINSATNLTSVTIPLFAVFGPGTLSGTARAMGDGYLEARGGVSAVYGVGRSDRVFGSVLGSYRANAGTELFSQGLANLTAGYAHGFANNDTLSISGQVQQFWYGNKSYRQAYGVVAQYTHMLQGGQALSFSAQYFRTNFDNQPLLDANRVAGSVSYADKLFVVTLTGGHEETVQQAGDAQSNSFAEFNAAAEIPIESSVSLIAGLNFDLRRYDAPDALFLVSRADERVDLNAGLKVRLASNLSLRPQASYTRNFSNIPINDFDRWTAGLGVRYEF